MPTYQAASDKGELLSTTFEAADDAEAGRIASTQPGAGRSSGAIRYTAPITSGKGGAGGTGLDEGKGGGGNTNLGLTDRYGNERKRIEATFGVLDEPNEKKLRAQYLARAQGAINAVNTKYAEIEASDRSQVELMNREQRASNMMSGLSGASVGSQRTIDTAADGKKLQDRTAAQKAAEVQAILENAETRSMEEFKREREAYLGQQKNRFDAEQSLFSRISETAKSEIKKLAGSTDYEDLKKTNPKLLAQYMEELDTDENGLKAIFLAGKEGKLMSDTPKILGNKAIWFEQGADGKIKEISIDLPEGSKEIESSRITDKGVQVLYTDGTYKIIGGVGSFKSGDTDSPDSPSTAGLSYEDWSVTPEAKKLLKDEEARRYMNLAPAARDTFLRSAYESSGAGGSSGGGSVVSLGKITPTLKSELSQAGLTGAKDDVKTFYINTPSTFRDFYARQAASGGARATSVQSLMTMYDDWAEKKDSGSDTSDEDLDAFLNAHGNK